MKRINQLIKDIERHPFEGIGKAEPLKGNLTGLWSKMCIRDSLYDEEEFKLYAPGAEVDENGMQTGELNSWRCV